MKNISKIYKTRVSVVSFVLFFFIAGELAFAGDTDLFGDKVNGSLNLKYRSRATDKEEDVDFFADLRLNVQATKTLSFNLDAREIIDMDENQKWEGSYVFDEIYKTQDNLKLYAASLDWKPENSLVRTLRFGRQYSYENYSFHFDGLRIETKEFEKAANLKAYFYVGMPVRYFSSPHYPPRFDCSSCHSAGGPKLSTESNGSLYGGGIQIRPWKTTRFSLDYTLLSDDTLYGDIDTDYSSLNVWHNFTDNVQMQLKYAMLEGEGTDFKALFNINCPDKNANIQLVYFKQLETLFNLPLEFDPFSYALNESHPYQNLGVYAYKGFGDKFFMSFGGDSRTVSEGDQNNHNMEYSHYWIAPGCQDIGRKGLSASVSLDFWNTDEDDITTYGANIDYKWMKKLKASVGTSFAVLKYDYITGKEQTDVRSYFMKLSYNVTDFMKIYGDYQFEDDEFDTYDTFQIGTSLEF